MLLSQIHKWLSSFEKKVCAKESRVRGTPIWGVKLEIFDDSEVVVVLQPHLRGNDAESRLNDFYKQILDEDPNRVLEAFIPLARFQRIVEGHEEIREEDWFWSDEDTP